MNVPAAELRERRAGEQGDQGEAGRESITTAAPTTPVATPTLVATTTRPTTTVPPTTTGDQGSGNGNMVELGAGNCRERECKTCRNTFVRRSLAALRRHQRAWPCDFAAGSGSLFLARSNHTLHARASSCMHARGSCYPPPTCALSVDAASGCVVSTPCTCTGRPQKGSEYKETCVKALADCQAKCAETADCQGIDFGTSEGCAGVGRRRAFCAVYSSATKTVAGVATGQGQANSTCFVPSRERAAPLGVHAHACMSHTPALPCC